MKNPVAVVGVRQFRARLSAYLRDVAGGKTVTIGDRRRPVARLVPIERSPDHELLDRLATQGVVKRGSGKPGAARRVTPRKRRPLASDLVIEDRG